MVSARSCDILLGSCVVLEAPEVLNLASSPTSGVHSRDLPLLIQGINGSSPEKTRTRRQILEDGECAAPAGQDRRLMGCLSRGGGPVGHRPQPLVDAAALLRVQPRALTWAEMWRVLGSSPTADKAWKEFW